MATMPATRLRGEGSAIADEEEKLRTGDEAGRDSTAVLGGERGEGAERAEGAGEEGREREDGGARGRRAWI